MRYGLWALYYLELYTSIANSKIKKRNFENWFFGRVYLGSRKPPQNGAKWCWARNGGPLKWIRSSPIKGLRLVYYNRFLAAIFGVCVWRSGGGGGFTLVQSLLKKRNLLRLQLYHKNSEYIYLCVIKWKYLFVCPHTEISSNIRMYVRPPPEDRREGWERVE